MTQTALETHQITISPLDKQALFQISGTDAEKFLQGQLSCDMKEVTQQGSRLGAHCNPKGSMHSILRVIKFNDSFLLRCNTENLNYAKDSLSKYMMFSKADCQDLSNTWQGIGISGQDTAKFVNQELGGITLETDQVATEHNFVITRVPGDRYEIWMPKDDLNKFLNALKTPINLSNSVSWYQQEIVQGIADIYPDTREQFIPQMCNLQALNGVSFKKGCYTGQEVITRLHFRGKLTKYLTIAKIETENAKALKRGDSIFDSEGNKVANILQYCLKEDWLYLQLITNQKHADQAMFLSSKAALTTLDQPYTLDPNLFIRKI